MLHKGIVKIAVVIILVYFAFGCVGTHPPLRLASNSIEGYQVIKTGTNEDIPTTPYRLNSGDVIDVKFFYTPDLNETLTIRPDGKISLQLIGDVQAAGLTPSELDEVLTDLYSHELKQAEIAVIVKTFSEYKVYIGGEVNMPGVIPLAGRLTTLQAIFNVGGFKNTAATDNVLIIRKGNKREPVEFLILDLSRVLSMESEDIFLNPFDVVYVPKSTIAEVNLFVSQYIDQVIPSSLVQLFHGFYYVETIRDIND